MNVLIVYAHMEPRSFNAALLGRAVDELERAGAEVKVSDLYAMKFTSSRVFHPTSFRNSKADIRPYRNSFT